MRLTLERQSISSNHLHACGSVDLKTPKWVWYIYRLHFLDLLFSQPSETRMWKYLWVFWDWGIKSVRIGNSDHKFRNQFSDIARGLKLDVILAIWEGDD